MDSKKDESGYLDVGDGHSIYFETYGKPKGKNILFLHGGPGGSFTEKDKRFFDPAVFNVILFDQRGSGKSRPLRCIQRNTTQKIINDITKLLNHLKIDKVILFGGSWGSTLSLLYAIENPKRVSTLVLRGVFTASNKSRQHFERGGTKLFFPEEWKRYAQRVRDNQSSNVSGFYFDKILSSNNQTRKKYSYELVRYGIAVSRKEISEEEIERKLESTDFITRAVLQSHYAINDFFLAENYIIDNLERLGTIPTYIVQGRYDMICPPKFALEINEKLQNSTLYLVNGGHSSQESEIESKLRLILKKITSAQ